MAYDLTSLQTTPVMRPPRILLLGIHKVGKSRTAAGAPGPIFLPIKNEEGIDDLIGYNDMQATPVCDSLEDSLGWLETLRTAEHNHATVVTDSASSLEPLLWETTIRRYNATRTSKEPEAHSIDGVHGGYSKGYDEATLEWRTYLAALDRLRSERNMASIIIGHVKTKQVVDPLLGPYDAFVFDIHHKAADLLSRWADCILFCNYKGAVTKEDIGFNKQQGRGIEIAPNQRFLYTQHRLSHPGGGRGVYGHLPYEIPLGWEHFIAAVNAASKVVHA